MAEEKTPGQIAYEADLALFPTLTNGRGETRGRKPWAELHPEVQRAWERDPEAHVIKERPKGGKG